MKHRRNAPTRTTRLQNAPRHRSDRFLERLGARAVTIDDVYGIVRRDDFPAELR